MSEIIVLDTHIWFWLMTQDLQKIPDSWQTAIETTTQVGVSAISCYEISLASQKGRLELPCPISEWLQEARLPSGIELFYCKKA